MSSSPLPVDSPIFVVGSPRSGTTLLRSILDAHPRICLPTWETGLFDRLSQIVNGDFSKPRGREHNYAKLERPALIAWFRRCADDLMSTLTQAVGKPRWGEKTPSHVYHMDLIHEVYPHAHFIHIIRDGRAVVRSLQNVEWNPGGLRWAIGRWVTSVRAGRESGARLPRGQYLEIRYEALTTDSEATIRTVCQFLGEPFAEQMLEFNRPNNNSWCVRQEPLQEKPLNKYRSLGLLERLAFHFSACDLQRELGYRR